MQSLSKAPLSTQRQLAGSATLMLNAQRESAQTGDKDSHLAKRENEPAPVCCQIGPTEVTDLLHVKRDRVGTWENQPSDQGRPLTMKVKRMQDLPRGSCVRSQRYDASRNLYRTLWPELRDNAHRCLGESTMIKLLDRDTNVQSAELSDEDLAQVIAALEEQSSNDQDYYIDTATLAFLAESSVRRDLLT